MCLSLKIFLLAFILLATTGCFREDIANVQRREMSGDCKQNEDREKAFWVKFIPKRKPSDVEREALAEEFRKVAFAYTNSQPLEIRKCLSFLTNHVEDLAYPEFSRLIDIAREPFGEEFLHTDKFKEFSTPQEFSDFLLVNVEMAKLFGALEVCRFNPGEGQGFTEVFTLFRLLNYQKYYRNRQLPQYEAIAKGYVSSWIEQVESKDGSSLRQARKAFLIERRRQKDFGGIEPSRPYIAARFYAQPFIRCGYTPKWLDREFPLPSEEMDRKNKEE